MRDDLNEDYKATRSAMPDDLRPQVELIQEILTQLGMKVVTIPGYEADDSIATIACRAAESGYAIRIFSGDKDLMALVNDAITVYAPSRDLDTERVLDRAGVFEKFGVYPEMIPDYLAMVGDSSDNIRGVTGIGPKTAAKLLADHQTLDGILAARDGFTPKMKQAFDGCDWLANTRELVRLHRDVDVGEQEYPAKLKPSREVVMRLADLALKSIAAELEPLLDEKITHSAALEIPPPRILSAGELAKYLERLASSPIAAFDTETTSLRPRHAEIIGVSFAADGVEPAYFPMHGGSEPLARYLADENAKKCGHNIKYDLQVLWRAGFAPRGFACDTMIVASLLNPLRRSQSLDALALELYQLEKIPFESLGDMRAASVEKVAAYAGEDAVVTLALHRDLYPRLGALEKLYREIEHPLIETLARMEWTGIGVDRNVLGELAVRFGEDLERVRAAATLAAGVEFNPDSPKQVGAVLFETLKLPAVRKIKTGYSTDSATLDELKGLHSLPGILLEYRELAKLINTYVLSLPALVDERTGRLHTCFNQARTATGRLSSTEPNLQNIPIKTARGREIRRAFVAPEGRRLVVADYGQIEFRIVAHLSGDPGLLEAFKKNIDLHALTAEKLFGDPSQRGRAKTINFGILYGQSAFGLSKTLGVPQRDAAAIIKGYYEAFPALKNWMDGILRDGTERGYVETLFGRRRPVEELKSSNKNLRSAAERIAINTPVQGTAADIIKIAMIKLSATLPKASILLQVHDELILEADERDAPEVEARVREAMTNIAPLEKILAVNAGIGQNWLEA